MECLIEEIPIPHFKQENDLENMSDKDLVKNIKDGSPDWHNWGFNEKNEKFYREIEKRNQAVPRPQGKFEKVFRDDARAIQKMEQKIMVLESRQDYWKKIIKFPARLYHNEMGGRTLGDYKWFEAGLVSTQLRDAKKKLIIIESQGELTRKPVFIDGKKHFKYEET